MGHSFEIRKKVILGRLQRDGSVLVKDIAEELNISESTIRRDLNELDSQGLLRQIYGGAVRMEAEPPGRLNFSITSRSVYNVDEKKRIGHYAASLVADNDIIYIDPGTTSWEMIPHLREKKNLTIISNSVRLLQRLEYIAHHTVIQLGGILRPDRLDTIGSLAQIGIEQLRGFKAFQGGDGFDSEFGLSAVDHESAFIAKTILAHAREIVVLADQSKFEKPSLLYKITDIDKINCLVTDRPLSGKWQEICDNAGVTVIVAAQKTGVVEIVF